MTNPSVSAKTDSQYRSRMVHLLALFLFAIVVGFMVHWAGYQWASGVNQNIQEDLSRIKPSPRRWTKNERQAFMEERRWKRAKSGGLLDEQEVDALMNPFMSSSLKDLPAQHEFQQDTGLLIPEVVRWSPSPTGPPRRLVKYKDLKKGVSFNLAKSRKGRFKEKMELERRKNQELRKERDNLEEIKKTTVSPASSLNNKEEDFVPELNTEVVEEGTKSSAPLSNDEQSEAEDGEMRKPTTSPSKVDTMQITATVETDLPSAALQSENTRKSRFDSTGPTKATIMAPTFPSSFDKELVPSTFSTLKEAENQKRKTLTFSAPSEMGEEDRASINQTPAELSESKKEQPDSSDTLADMISSFNPYSILGNPPLPTTEKTTEEDDNNSAAVSYQSSKNRLLSIPNFTWLMNNESLCKLNPEYPSSTRLLPILILSARSHYTARQAIRHSWGSLKSYKNWQIRPIFLLGEATREENANEKLWKLQQLKLVGEQQKYGDLVMGNFIDSPKNLSIKHLMGFKWILNFCQNATFVFKVDDNIFLNTMLFIDARNMELDQASSKKLGYPKPAEIYCKVKSKVKPKEGSEAASDWHKETYPDYCHRWAYGADVESIQKFYSVSHISKYFWKDDVFATGVLRQNAEEKYRWVPKIGLISSYTSPSSLLNSDYQTTVRGLCKNGEWSKEWPINAVTYLKSGELGLERDMRCMWAKTLYDRRGGGSKRIRIKGTGKPRILQV